MVYVLAANGNPLMPCSERKARILLDNGKATVKSVSPFGIQLVYRSSAYKQQVSLGIDTGYSQIGFSAVTSKRELIGGEVTLLRDLAKRLRQRAEYRRNRRSRLRYRTPGWRTRTTPKAWLAPSIKHKLDSHAKFIQIIKGLIPVTETILEVANFDIQKIVNPNIQGIEYQQGLMFNFENVKAYVLHRDNHSCQHPNCKQKNKKLHVHHVGYWRNDYSDRPDNLIVLCAGCHTKKAHQEGGSLYGWQPKFKGFKEAIFMNILKSKLVAIVQCKETYGYLTKLNRVMLKLDKSHHNDAFVIAGGKDQERVPTTFVKQKRKNSRKLETFRDATYIDLRDGKVKSGKVLSSSRTSRNRENLGLNERTFRARKRRAGARYFRNVRYKIQSGDLVKYNSKIYESRGVISNGRYLQSVDKNNNPARLPSKKTKLYFRQRTFMFRVRNHQ